MARARELGVTSIAFPALGTGVGGFPLDEAARGSRSPASATRCPRAPTLNHVIFALRGAATYQAFEAAIAATEPRPRRGSAQ